MVLVSNVKLNVSVILMIVVMFSGIYINTSAKTLNMHSLLYANYIESIKLQSRYIDAKVFLASLWSCLHPDHSYCFRKVVLTYPALMHNYQWIWGRSDNVHSIWEAPSLHIQLPESSFPHQDVLWFWSWSKAECTCDMLPREAAEFWSPRHWPRVLLPCVSTTTAYNLQDTLIATI